MTLASQMQTDVSSVFLDTEEHAEAASYTPSGGVATDITIIVEREIYEQPQFGDDGKTRVKSLTFLCAVADYPTVTIHEDTITARGATFKVVAMLDSDSSMRRMQAESAVEMRKSRQDYEKTR